MLRYEAIFCMAENKSRNGLDRRQFITTLATAAGVAPALRGSALFASSALQAAPPPPSNVRLVTQRVVTLADLTWLGTFKSPSAVGANGGALNYPYFTLRRVNGVLKTLWLGTFGGGFAPPYQLIQADYPGFDPSLANSPGAEGNVRNFGNGFLSLCVGQNGRQMSSMYVNGIHWDSNNNCVWLVYADPYNTSQYKDPVLIRGDIDDSAPDSTAVKWSGPWRLTGSVPNSTAQADSHQTQSYVVSVPPAYGTAHLGGATIALGGAYSSGGSSSPFNNVLWAPKATPNASTPNAWPAGGPDLQATCLIGGDIGHRGHRPGDYTTVNCPGAGVGDVDPTTYSRSQLSGTWGVMDSSGSAVWLDWDTVKGVLFFVTHGRGHIWYNNAGLQGGSGHCNHGVTDRYNVTGPESVVSPTLDAGKPYGVGPDLESALYAYDPDQFVAVAGGSPWNVPVKDWGYMLDRFPNFAVSQAPGQQVVIRPNAIAADQTSRLIMIPCGNVTGGSLGAYGFYVNVFKVAS